MRITSRFINRPLLIILLLSYGIFANRAEARPEYALKLQVNRCTMCHASPVGGGIRNLTGKSFGARNFRPAKYGEQDLISMDARALYYFPENTTPRSRGGFAWMAGIVGANVPITPPEEKNELRLVYAHNISGFSTDREFFLRWQRHADNDDYASPQYVVLGRFHAPFGIVSDEHRPYTRIQTQTTWNHFEMGALLSGNAGERLHYDLALVNGENTAGGALASDQAAIWGCIANIRLSPNMIPIILGLSASHHGRPTGQPPSSAGSLYGLISIDDLTDNAIPASVILEYVRAEQMNRNLENNFIDTSGTYDETILNGKSEGILAQFNYDLNPLTTLVFRYDQLIFDVEFPKDAFRRYGLGARRYLYANTILTVRYEVSEANHPSQKDTAAKSAIDAFYMVLQVGI